MRKADHGVGEGGFGKWIRDIRGFEVGSNSATPETSQDMRGWEIDTKGLVAQENSKWVGVPESQSNHSGCHIATPTPDFNPN